MSGIGAKWAVRRYQPAIYTAMQDEGARPLVAKGKEQVFDAWRDVVEAADTIVGDNCLEMGVEPDAPVVLQHGEDVILIYMKLEI